MSYQCLLPNEILAWLSSIIKDWKDLHPIGYCFALHQESLWVFSSHTTASDESILVGDHRQFLKRSSCTLEMVAGKRYLLMGKDGQTVDCNNK